MKKLSLIGLVVCWALAGCAPLGTGPRSQPKPIEPLDLTNANFGDYPKKHEETIKAWALQNLKDPDSARFGRFSKPRKEYLYENSKPVYGYSVCAEINAKNSYGGYTGSQTYWFLIRNESIQRAQNTTTGLKRMISLDHFVNCEDGN